MKRIRLRVFFLATWLILFCNIERMIEPLYFSRPTFTITLVMIAIAIVLPRFIRMPFGVMLAIPVLLTIFSRLFTGNLGQDVTILLIFMESLGISLSIYLAYLVNEAISEFENSVANIMIGQQEKSPLPYSVGENLIYQEVRRARNHQRPLTIMSVAVEDQSIKSTLDRLAQEAQKNLIKQYTLARVSKTLCEKLEGSDIIVLRDDQFLIVLPETQPEHIPGLIDRLQRQVVEQVGVTLKIGTASLPMDGYTLAGLIDKASSEIQTDPNLRHISEIELLTVKHNSP